MIFVARLAEVRKRLRAVVRSLVPGTLVLMYHRIADEPVDPEGLCVSPARFAAHLEILRTSGVKLASAKDLARKVSEGGGAPRGAVVTFDDGYRDNFTAAKPLLERYDAPATFFITAGQVGSGREFWWDVAARIIFATPELPSELTLHSGGRTHRYEIAAEAPSPDPNLASLQGCPIAGRPTARRTDLYRRVFDLLFSADPDERERLRVELLSWAGLPDHARETHATMTVAELAELSRCPLVEIGAHSWSHPDLSRLGHEEQRKELARSKKRLEEIIDRRIVGCSYPHGRFGAVTQDFVRETGYAYACSSIPTLTRKRADVFAIPRVVVGNWPAAEFGSFVREFLRV